ncbi:MAG TPA: FKBP-type peptidyl-prolyl cis-trans isomerase [Rhodocyclaceae bacterium]|jgi:FKBP-type peptidyl-prolyl cis-trans isomerase SlpA
MTETVKPDSFVTLHYRLAADDGLELMNTFKERPATLKMGSGQLAPTLEGCVLGMAEGERKTFKLEPGQAFGARTDDLVQRIARSQISDNYVVESGAQVDFMSETGEKFSGFVRNFDETTVLMDFNHPLAGKHLEFEVQVIGVL